MLSSNNIPFEQEVQLFWEYAHPKHKLEHF